MYNKILIPVDLDYPEVAAKAMEVAKSMARAAGASLTVISVQPIVIDESGHPPPNYQPKMDAYLARQGGDLKGIMNCFVIEPLISQFLDVRCVHRPGCAGQFHTGVQ